MDTRSRRSAAAGAVLAAAALFLAGCPAAPPSPTPPPPPSPVPETTAKASSAAAYANYANARFGYAVEYPADLLTPQGEADNGDGQRFLSADGKAELLVFGRHDLAPDTGDAATPEAAEQAEAAAGRKVTYRAKGSGWFVVSGTGGDGSGGTVFYRKTLARDGVLVTASLEYPRARRDVFDTVAEKVAASLRWSPTTTP